MLSKIVQDVASMRPLTRAEIHAEKQWLRALLKDAERTLGVAPINWIIEFNGRFTARMGDCRVMDYATRTVRVRFSATPLWRRASPVKRRNTGLHEGAHGFAQLLAGPLKRVGHGPLWKQTMRRLGEEPKRCHTVNRDGLRRRRSPRRRRAVILRPAPIQRPSAPVARPSVAPLRIVGAAVSFRLRGEQGSGIVLANSGGRLSLRVVGDHGRAFFGAVVEVSTSEVW